MAFGLAVGPGLDDCGSNGWFVGNDPSDEGYHQTIGGISDPGFQVVTSFGSDHLLEAIKQIASGDKLRNRLLDHSHRNGVVARDLVALATSALLMATQRQQPGAGLIQHSDRGIQYACGDYQAALEVAGITPSMSRRANPLDSTPMESFLHTLKTELVHHRTHATHDEARRDLFLYVEGFYNRQRLDSALDYRTPDQAEQQAENVA